MPKKISTIRKLSVGDLVYHLLYGREWHGIILDIKEETSGLASPREIALVAMQPNTEYEFFRDDVPAKSQVNASPQGLNLEGGDAITVQAATGSSKIQGLISYALINRENENG